MRVFILLILSVLIKGCYVGEAYVNISLLNNSNKKILFLVQKSIDNSLIQSSDNLVAVEKNEQQNKSLSLSNLKTSTESNVHVFVFDNDSIQKYSWTEIIAKQNYLKRFDLKVFPRYKDRKKNGENLNLVYP